MKPILNLITITKDDLEGIEATILSTKKLRACNGVKQIIVDSSDATVSEKVKALLLYEDNLEYIWQEPSGIAAAFNLGVRKLNAKWVWFLNGRDEVHPDLDENFLLQILNASKADVMIFQIEYMGSRLKRKRNPPLWSLWPPMYPNWVPHPGTFIRTSLFEQYGRFDPEFKIAMDTDLWMRLFSENVTVDMLSIPVTLYDIQGVSATNPAARDIEVRRIIRKNIKMLSKKWLFRGMHLFKAAFLATRNRFTDKLFLLLAKMKRFIKHILLRS